MIVPSSDFSYVTDVTTRMMYEDMHAAITKAEAWAWVARDPGEGGFMFNDSETSRRIAAVLTDRVGHTGASYGFTMRAMQRLVAPR